LREVGDERDATVRLADVGYRRVPTRLVRMVYAPAICDWILAAYFFTVIAGLGLAHPTLARDTYLALVTAVLAAFMGCVYLFRLRLEPRRRSYLAELGYHLLPVLAILMVFFNLRPILPIINSASFDDSLYQIDVGVLGFEPTLLVERWSTPAVVEWFAFFYYSYFFLLASFVFCMILCTTDDQRRSHFATGIVLIVAIGHFFYTLVPGYGPYIYLAHDYRAPLEGGRFYGLVLDAVSGAGSLRDIFPSLHTAVPTFCALFAWRHYPRIAPVATFFAVNIMVATIVLRWHYAADVAAGLLLAGFAFALAPRLVEAYQARRAEVGLAQLRRW
jgi:membrane-associated phospholipid phosphatase